MRRRTFVVSSAWLATLGGGRSWVGAAPPATVAAAGGPRTSGRSTLPLGRGWTTTGLLASVHATQAAAADGGHVYAVSSTHVARHDRRSGRLLAAATSPGTTHLNSGFVHDGRVYCAHSNYPAEPPESDVRVFDPATDTLAVHHVFRDPPGSLVWCATRGGNWWCCFARYHAANAGTVLVEYADGGFERECRRFTFPAAVVADWDGMSASGGMWDGETLLASHHHFQVLYRLAVPPAGTELSLVEAVACPFPGQGFASDPLTGGLVGIDRGRRCVMFAARERPAPLVR